MDRATVETREIYFRNFVFGVEDSLVSTVGLLSGIAVAGTSRSYIVLTGVILIFVEAISMAAGSYLSEYSAEEFAAEKNAFRKSLQGSLVMLASYFAAGFIPLFPYMLDSVLEPFRISIGVSLFTLFLLGLASGRLAGMNPMRCGARMLMVGGVAIVAGILVGTLLK